MLPAYEGYSTAKATLAELVRGKLTSGSADELMEFSIKIQNCQSALAQLNPENELSSVTNMEGL